MTRRRPLPAPTAVLLAASTAFLSSCGGGQAGNAGPTPRVTATATPSVPALPDLAAGLVGDTSAEITAAFGAPSLRRDEGTAEIWLYATPDGCRVHLVLYRDGTSATVAHAAANTPPHTSEKACLRKIAAGRTPEPVT